MLQRHVHAAPRLRGLDGRGGPVGRRWALGSGAEVLSSAGGTGLQRGGRAAAAARPACLVLVLTGAAHHTRPLHLLPQPALRRRRLQLGGERRRRDPWPPALASTQAATGMIPPVPGQAAGVPWPAAVCASSPQLPQERARYRSAVRSKAASVSPTGGPAPDSTVLDSSGGVDVGARPEDSASPAVARWAEAPACTSWREGAGRGGQWRGGGR